MLEAAGQQPLIATSIAQRAVIEQRAIAMLGDDGNASLGEIFAHAGVPRSAFATGLRAMGEARASGLRAKSNVHPYVCPRHGWTLCRASGLREEQYSDIATRPRSNVHGIPVSSRRRRPHRSPDGSAQVRAGPTTRGLVPTSHTLLGTTQRSVRPSAAGRARAPILDDSGALGAVN